MDENGSSPLRGIRVPEFGRLSAVPRSTPRAMPGVADARPARLRTQAVI